MRKHLFLSLLSLIFITSVSPADGLLPVGKVAPDFILDGVALIDCTGITPEGLCNQIRSDTASIYTKLSALYKLMYLSFTTDKAGGYKASIESFYDQYKKALLKLIVEAEWVKPYIRRYITLDVGDHEEYLYDTVVCVVDAGGVSVGHLIDLLDTCKNDDVRTLLFDLARDELNNIADKTTYAFAQLVFRLYKQIDKGPVSTMQEDYEIKRDMEADYPFLGLTGSGEG